MRLTWLVMPAVLSIAAFAACSSSSTPAGSGNGVDASTGGDSSSPPDQDSGGSTPEGGTDSSVADTGVVPTTCMTPATCGATDVCCGTIPITGGTVPNCTTGTISTVCKAATDCATKLGTSCSGTQTVRLCTKNADCAEPANNKCCTFGGSGGADAGSLSFCASALVAAFGGGTCM